MVRLQQDPRSEMYKHSLSSLRAAVNQAYLADEKTIVNDLLASLSTYDSAGIGRSAETLVKAVRAQQRHQPAIEAFLHEYRLNSQEGIVLMGIAEALLRIPDSPTQDRFLQEKLTGADWENHLLHSDSLLVQMTNKALSLSSEFEQRVLSKHDWFPVFERLLAELGAPVIRNAVKQAMRVLAWQFVYSGSIKEAVQLGRDDPGHRFSFDMLGEAALTGGDAERYFRAYSKAIAALAEAAIYQDIFDNPGISIKLSALCPRFEPLQHRRAIPELTEKLTILVRAACAANISVTVDAEESERLDMSLDIFAAVFSDTGLAGWPGFGLAVQAYQKRALPVLRWLSTLAAEHRRKIPVRLVKGAYWDSEIKRAQENGLSGYPVFTHKSITDLSYLACAEFLLARTDAFYPQFASHNAHTVCAIHHMGDGHPGFEFQRLHGMGESLFRELQARKLLKWPCRVYAPVGDYQELLPYLVRRLLENGANTSFINQIDHPDLSVEELIRDPVVTAQNVTVPSAVVLPKQLFGDRRLNSQGLNLADSQQLFDLQEHLDRFAERKWSAASLINGIPVSGKKRPVTNPADRRQIVGFAALAEPPDIVRALTEAAQAFVGWRLTSVSIRADSLRKAADRLEANRLELVSLCIREGGRTIRDALAEVREAVDYCRYYAQSAEFLFAEPVKLPGPTGEDNLLYQYGRGVFVCISPWNFPIAIFIGQIAAALAAGNTVIAKPAGQSVLTGMRCIQLLHQAGIPESVLQFIPADGGMTGRCLIPDPRVAGIAFTGSTATAQAINRQLAQHRKEIIPLIAETGGQNAMIADSSALPEQLVSDVIISAFNSAGQRCSALRVLFLQQEIADKVIKLLIGAMKELTLGDPGEYATDVGPVIDHPALERLQAHVNHMAQQTQILFQLPVPASSRYGSFFPPTLIEIQSLTQLTEEVFGPILHVIRYREDQLTEVIAAVNATGYGLTLGVHSRINGVVQTIRQNAKVGNVYVNRNMIGAVVGVQPFGGTGLSGTGPKAGGPNYLGRFAVEQTVATNTAAVGGNAALLTQDLDHLS